MPTNPQHNPDEERESDQPSNGGWDRVLMKVAAVVILLLAAVICIDSFLAGQADEIVLATRVFVALAIIVGGAWWIRRNRDKHT